MSKKAYVVDSDTERRNAICREFILNGENAEPIESFIELEMNWPTSGVLLIADENRVLESCILASQEHDTWIPIVAYSSAPVPQRIMVAARYGVSDYLAWPTSSAVLSSSVERASYGADKENVARYEQMCSFQKVKALTPRETQVLNILCKGESNKAIARQLDISHRTVEIHRSNMMAKLGANHPNDALRILMKADRLKERRDLLRAIECKFPID